MRTVQIMWPPKDVVEHLLQYHHPDPKVNQFVQGTLSTLDEMDNTGEPHQGQEILSKINSYLYYAMLDESLLSESDLEEIATLLATYISEPLSSVRNELQIIASVLAETPILIETNRYGIFLTSDEDNINGRFPPPRRSSKLRNS